MADAFIIYIIINKFGYWQELSLVISLITDKDVDLNLKNIILDFSLAIILRVKSFLKLLQDF